MVSFSDQIRRAIEDSGLSRYWIARLTGISEATLSRFMAGKSMTTDRLDVLAALLRMTVSAKGPTKTAIANVRRQTDPWPVDDPRRQRTADKARKRSESKGR